MKTLLAFCILYAVCVSEIARAQAPQDCSGVLVALQAAKAPIAPSSAATDCCNYDYESTSNRSDPNYYENFVNCESGRVIGLQLANLNVSSLSYFESLTGIKRLYLPNASLTGTLPSYFSNLALLEELSLGNNNLTGSTSVLSGLPNLRKIYLSKNQFSGSLSWLSTMTQVREIFIAHNQFSGTFPDLTRLSSLTYLDAGSNYFTGLLPSTLAFPNLTRYDVSQNPRLSGTLPSSVFKLPQLETLSVYSTSIGGTVDAALSNQTNLRTLYLDDTLISGPLPDLRALVSLTRIDLSNTSLSGPLYLSKSAGTIFCGLGRNSLCLPNGDLSQLSKRCQTSGGNELLTCQTLSVTTTSTRISTISTPSTTTSPVIPTPTPGPEPANHSVAIAGGVVGGVVGLALIGALGFFCVKKRSPLHQSLPLPLYSDPNLGAKPQPQAPLIGSLSAGSMAATLVEAPRSPTMGPMSPSSPISPSVPPASLISQISYASSVGSVVNQMYVCVSHFQAAQEDEMSCEPGQKIFVDHLFADQWCKGLNIQTMRSGYVPLALLVPATDQAALVARLMEQQPVQTQPRMQSTVLGSQAQKVSDPTEAIASLRYYLNQGILTSQEYIAASGVLQGQVAEGQGQKFV
ncbi:L domain-like protein [Gonapodya prolifera JEL478]|uniref:L domain-like protein n=1 Tax=Gonapodya prolifera (strain JEL478) TaxID=1344416 RepID=A0A138ZXD3_GONPJ|nr:L domain-like protein [Gonapodya prolifera JEL478]|eukprot:KXS09176.1 L domain-like protein [Gonapodya prolifera JEL478]